MKGNKSKHSKEEYKNRKSDGKRVTENEIETNVSIEMTDQQFLLEIEEYARKLKEDENHDEEYKIQDSKEDEQELEIDHLHQVIDDLKEELETAKIKVQSLKEVIDNKNKVIESLKDKVTKENSDVETKELLKCRMK